jgi:hypothetical protein
MTDVKIEKTGLKAVAHNASPTAVDANAPCEWHANRDGVPFFMGGHPQVVSREYMTTAVQTGDTIIASVTGTVVVTMVSVMVDNACTVNPKVRIGFGESMPAEPSSGNTVDRVILAHGGIAPGSGVVIGNGAGIVGMGAANAELYIANDVPTGGQINVVVSYYIIDS